MNFQVNVTGKADIKSVTVRSTHTHTHTHTHTNSHTNAALQGPLVLLNSH